MKKNVWKNMVSNRVPKRLWGYGLVYQDSILNRISRGKTGQTGIEEITGQMPDISDVFTLISMIVCGGSIRGTLQQRVITLSLVSSSGYYTKHLVTCSIGY